jgi:hypothetical protein
MDSCVLCSKPALVKQNREVAIDAMMKSELDRQLAACLRRHDWNFYDQRRGRRRDAENDHDIVREVFKVTK